jgi:predicted SAM-dependent methyltransferase
MTVKQKLGRMLFARMPITRFLFNQLRLELNGLSRRFESTILPSRRSGLKAIRRSRGLYVNVGCGPQVLSGFVNLDIVPAAKGVIGWDCRRTLPLDDASAAGIRAEHFVEHLEPREELPAFLRASLRALEPGGVLRIVVPDAERYLMAYSSGGDKAFHELGVPRPFPSDLPTRMDLINHVFHQWDEHRWGYDFESLAHRLRTAGFDPIEKTSYRHSRDPRLAEDLAAHMSYSLYVDAVKP